jgi:hypothetical protein
MNAAVDNQILLPVARLVQGDLYEPQTEDMQGNKLTVKSGENAGKDRVNYFFSVAIPKAGEQIWWQTQWGAKVYALAQAAWPAWFDPSNGACKHPKFSWKIIDGDDATPNPEANMRRNCDREGFPGHWVVRCSSGFATKVFDESGNPLLQPGLVKCGYWVEVLISINTNGNTQKPGMFINHNMVAYRAPGKEIIAGPDPRTVGFGRSALPAGVTAQPLGNTANMPAAAGLPPAPGAMPPPPPSAAAMPPPPPAAAPVGMAPPPPAGVPVQAHPGFIAPPGGAMPPVPGAPVAAAVPTPPPPAAAAAPPAAFVCPLGAPAGFRMVNQNGGRYDAFRQNSWTDAQLLQAGHMVKL